MPAPTAIRTLGEFREALDSGRCLVITDSVKGARVHPDPEGCPHVQERSFEEKVLTNSERNGSYFSVATTEEALQEWPEISVCRSAACAVR